VTNAAGMFPGEALSAEVPDGGSVTAGALPGSVSDGAVEAEPKSIVGGCTSTAAEDLPALWLGGGACSVTYTPYKTPASTSTTQVVLNEFTVILPDGNQAAAAIFAATGDATTRAMRRAGVAAGQSLTHRGQDSEKRPFVLEQDCRFIDLGLPKRGPGFRQPAKLRWIRSFAAGFRPSASAGAGP
jgi:hypothetical protein